MDNARRSVLLLLFTIVLRIVALTLVVVASVNQFGWLNGFALAAAVWLVMPREEVE